MSYAGKIELQKKAVLLRENGYSISHIQQKLGVSKSSVSKWVRNVFLTDSQIKQLYQNKKTGGLKGSYIASRNKIKKKAEITKHIHDNAIQDIGKLSERDAFIAGIALYFGEGDKTDKSVGFTNGNTHAIRFMCAWLRNYCTFNESKFRAQLYIHSDLNEKEARAYWSEITRIPLKQFTKTHIVQNNPNRYRKSILPHGVLRVSIHDINLHRKIMGWISGIFEI